MHESFFATQPLSMNVSGTEGLVLDRQTSPFSQAYQRAGAGAVLASDPVQAADARQSAPVVLTAGKVHKVSQSVSQSVSPPVRPF